MVGKGKDLPSCDAMKCCSRISMFQRTLLPPSSGWRVKMEQKILQNFGILPQHYITTQMTSTWTLFVIIF